MSNVRFFLKYNIFVFNFSAVLNLSVLVENVLARVFVFY